MHMGNGGGRLASDASAAATKRFGSYEVETERSARTHQVGSNPALDGIWGAWAACRLGIYFGGSQLQRSYEKILYGIRELKYSAADIESLSLELINWQGEESFSEKAGLFLSALINTSQEDGFVIHTANLNRINLIGYCNEKEVIVKGNCNRGVGSEMKGGSIQVDGNAEEIGSGMECGKITVNGNADGNIGWFMKGGEITVEGNAGEVGRCMFNGSITVTGDVEQLGCHMLEGTILVGGNTGDNLCLNMSGGLITIRGNAGIGIGQGQNGGSITVNGNAGELLGIQMADGIIMVNGNAGKDIGLEMSGGEIHIDGDQPRISDELVSGKVFHKGRLIFEK